MVLPMGSLMEAMGGQKLYAPSPTPILYVGLAANVLGRVPLMPLFLLGNYTPTILQWTYTISASTGAPGFHMGGQIQPTSRAGREATPRANVYKINQWLWKFGRGKPRLGGLSVAETEERGIAVAKDGAKRAVRPGPEGAARLLRRQGPLAD